MLCAWTEFSGDLLFVIKMETYINMKRFMCACDERFVSGKD